MFVLDCSVSIAWCLDENNSYADKVLDLLTRQRKICNKINLAFDKNMVTIYPYNQIGRVVMSQVIRISEDLYQRLEVYAQGFDTPSQVIEKMINFYENENNIKPKSIDSAKKKSTRLEIIYHPDNDVKLFKQKLIESRIAYIKLYKINNEIEIKEWCAYKFTNNSDVEKNLRSGHLRGWMDKGIFKAELSTSRDDFN